MVRSGKRGKRLIGLSRRSMRDRVDASLVEADISFYLHLQSSYPAWEDVAQKAVKLSVQLRSTIVALDQFLDALQKISDYATNTKGRHA